MLFREEALTIRQVAELLAAKCSEETIGLILDGLISAEDDLGLSDHDAAVAEMLLDSLMERVGGFPMESP